jgi:hypothetical protein
MAVWRGGGAQLVTVQTFARHVSFSPQRQPNVNRLRHTADDIGIMCQVSVLVGLKLIGDSASHRDGCIAGAT